MRLQAPSFNHIPSNSSSSNKKVPTNQKNEKQTPMSNEDSTTKTITNAIPFVAESIIQKKDPKVVSFKPTVVMYKTLHINDLSHEEIDSIWYNDEEYTQITNDCQKTITIMMFQEESVIDTDRYCSRGLEHMTLEGKYRRQTKRHAALTAVLDEQEHMWDVQKNDTINNDSTTIKSGEESIASMYRRHTVSSREIAYKQGLYDQQQICESSYSSTPQQQQQPQQYQQQDSVTSSTRLVRRRSPMLSSRHTPTCVAAPPPNRVSLSIMFVGPW